MIILIDKNIRKGHLVGYMPYFPYKIMVTRPNSSPFWSTDLANLVNIAAIKAAVEGAEKLNAAQLEFAKDRIMMGTERKTMFLSEDSKKVLLISFMCSLFSL